MEQKEALIVLDKVELSYGKTKNEVVALKDVNLSIEKGEFVCLLGPSGCGKSTLLKILAGFLKPAKGTAKMAGEDIIGPDWKRGVMFQDSTLYPWLNVRENVAFGPKVRGIGTAERDKICEHFLEQVQLKGFGDKKIFELSGGMKQRCALARVLANSPEVILMDEPFGALDALTRENMQQLIRNIWKENGNTVFLITHDIDEALSLGSRVLVMSKRPGTIVKDITVDFTNRIYGQERREADKVKYTEEYFTVREEILSIINEQHEVTY